MTVKSYPIFLILFFILFSGYSHLARPIPFPQDSSINCHPVRTKLLGKGGLYSHEKFVSSYKRRNPHVSRENWLWIPLLGTKEKLVHVAEYDMVTVENSDTVRVLIDYFRKETTRVWGRNMIIQSETTKVLIEYYGGFLRLGNDTTHWRFQQINQPDESATTLKIEGILTHGELQITIEPVWTKFLNTTVPTGLFEFKCGGKIIGTFNARSGKQRQICINEETAKLCNPLLLKAIASIYLAIVDRN